MEFWYRGGQGCNEAVKDRSFELKEGRPTILIGRNGSGKSLAATLVELTRKAWVSNERDAMYEWRRACIELGIEELGFSLDLKFYGVERGEEDRWRGIEQFQQYDGMVEFVRNFFEENDVSVPIMHEETIGPEFHDRWEVYHSRFDLMGRMVFEFHNLHSAQPTLAARLIPICKYRMSSLEYHFGAEDDEEEGVEESGTFGCDVEQIGKPLDLCTAVYNNHTTPNMPLLNHILEHINNEEIASAYSDCWNLMWDEAERVLCSESGQNGCEEDNLGLPFVGLWADGIYDNRCLDPKIRRAFPKLNYVSVDRVWGREDKRLVRRDLLGMLIANYSWLIKEGQVKQYPSLIEFGMGFRLGELFATPGELYEYCPDKRLEVIWHIIPMLDKIYHSGIGKGAENEDPPEHVIEQYRRLGDRLRTNWIDHHPSPEDIRQIVSLLLEQPNELYRLVQRGVRHGLWRIPEEGFEAFVQALLEFTIASNNCRWSSTETLVLFELHRSLFTGEDDEALAHALELVDVISRPEHLPSGFKRLLSMVASTTDGDNWKERVHNDDPYKNREPFILFIDEPEISLHIDWQEKVVDLLGRLVKRFAPSGSMLLIATHSPEVIMNHQRDVVDFTNYDEG